MMAQPIELPKTINLADRDFTDRKYDYYAELRRSRPVSRGRIAVVNVHLVARYADAIALTKSKQFLRNRGTITGGGRMPFPLPKHLALLAQSMIVEDDPQHRRLRNLVQKAFAPRSLDKLVGRVETVAHQLLDDALAKPEVDLQRDYALQIPTIVIGEMVGVSQAQMPKVQSSVRVLSDGLSGWNILRTILWDLRRTADYIRELVNFKRVNPGDDILSDLIAAEEAGDFLTEDELVSLVFLLIVAGYETTAHLITNGVHALVTHPEQMARLRAQPELMGSAVEEMLRFCPPVHGTKMNYAVEDLEIAGYPIKKGEAVIPLLACANRDSEMFADPDVFDVGRSDNKHLSFSQGNHFCLGAFLARMETKLAFQVLLERTQDISFAVPAQDLVLQKMPLWHRYKSLPVRLK
jgi:cytochrome P450